MATLGNPKNTIEVLQKYHFNFQKKFGQNFLINTSILEEIIDAAEITREDFVLEIGPGIGTMTQYLCEAAREVVAVEIDTNLIPILGDTLSAYDNVEVMNADILKVDIAKLADERNGGKPIKVVANLPYYITTPIIMGLFESHVPIDSITIMVQKEVADRMQEGPGSKEYGALSQNARTIAKALRMNEDLVEAIALGHDLGHTPFGHAGEYILNKIYEGGFKHNEQSVRIVEKLEKDGAGLNLTWEVRDGILNHQTKTIPHTLEGKIVRLSDKIAYVNSDIDDAIRAQILNEEDIPLELRKTLGFDSKKRLNHLIHDIITHSMGKDDIIMSDETAEALRDLRLFMFEHVYKNPVAKSEEVKAKVMLEQMYHYYMDHIELLPGKLLNMLGEGEDKGRVVCDYISGMTDQYAITKFKEYFMPQAWQVDGY